MTPTQRLKTASSEDQGFTLLEVLVAILIIVLAASIITPAIIVSISSRLQAQRIEQANKLAQAEVDRVRSIVERGAGSYATADLPTVPAGVDFGTAYSGVAAPLSSKTATDPTVQEVDVNSDGQPDYVVQSFRDTGICDQATAAVTPGLPLFSCSDDPDPANDVARLFRMGVRVYSIQAFKNDGAPAVAALDRKPVTLLLSAPATTTTGGASFQRFPLVSLTSEIGSVANSKQYRCFKDPTSLVCTDPTID